MSSILDALKKSEAERQRGLPPTLDSPAAFQRTRPAARRSSRLWLPVLALVAIGAAWGTGMLDFGGGAPEEPAPIADAPTGEDVVAITPAQAAGGDSAGETAAPASEAPPAVTPAPAGGAPAATSGADGAPRRISFGSRYTPEARARAAAIAAQQHGETPAAGTDTDPSTSSPSSPTAESPTESAQPTPPTREVATPAATAASPVPETPVADAPAASAPAAAPLSPSASGGVPTLYELPFAARRALPEVAVTMHVYSADPDKRFALVNGTRVRDGESLEGGLEVVRIVPQGVQLRFEDTEFVLPVGN